MISRSDRCPGGIAPAPFTNGIPWKRPGGGDRPHQVYTVLWARTL